MGPKHCIDVSKNEMMRWVRITSEKKVDVLAMCIPSRGGFNADYYPEFNSNEASNTAQAWCDGTDVEPKKMQMTAKPKEGRKTRMGLKNKNVIKAA